MNEGARLPGRKDRIAIVGGGPAGLHAAWLLRERGFENVTVYERAKRIGGKSLTVERDGVLHELGTCYLHPAYAEVKRLLALTRASTELKPGGRDGRRDLYSKELTGQLETPLDLGEWMLGAIEQASFPKFLWWAPDKLQAGNLVLAVQRYKLLHKKIFGEYTGSLPPRPDTDDMDRIDKTFGEFLSDNRLEALRPLMVLSSSAMGYGLPETIPALYGMWWNTPAVLEAFLASGQDPDKPVLTMLENGFGSLWDALARELRIETGVRVDHATRTPEGVHLSGRKHKEEWSVDADWLVVATNLNRTQSWLDLDGEELHLFEGMHTATLVTHLVEVDTRDMACIVYWPDRLRVGLPGRLYCVRDSRRCLQPDAPLEPRTTLVTYQYADHWKRRRHGPSFESMLRQDLSEAGFTGVKVLQQHQWPYFTRFTQDGINRGHPWRLFERQGANRTFFLGGSACFESVHDITTYNRQVFDKVLPVAVS